MSSSRRSNGSGGHRPSPSHSSSSSGYSNMSSIQEIARPGSSTGPRMQTSNTQFYSQPGGVADVQNADRVNRNPSSSSIPPYTSDRPPTYHSRTSSQQAQGSSGGHRPTGSNSSARPATNVSDPPTYHSRPSSQPAQGQGYGQQQQQQQQRPAQQQQSSLAVPQQRQGFRQRTSERLRNMLRRNRDRPN